MGSCRFGRHLPTQRMRSPKGFPAWRWVISQLGPKQQCPTTFFRACNGSPGKFTFWGSRPTVCTSSPQPWEPWEPPNTASYAGLLQNSGGVSADSLPQIDIVSPDILAGRDVNLASLLIPGFKSQKDTNQLHLVMDGDVILLKGLTDSRLNKKKDYSGIHPGFHYV